MFAVQPLKGAGILLKPKKEKKKKQFVLKKTNLKKFFPPYILIFLHLEPDPISTFQHCKAHILSKDLCSYFDFHLWAATENMRKYNSLCKQKL